MRNPFVTGLPLFFEGSLTTNTLSAEGPSAESFDKPFPRQLCRRQQHSPGASTIQFSQFYPPPNRVFQSHGIYYTTPHCEIQTIIHFVCRLTNDLYLYTSHSDNSSSMSDNASCETTPVVSRSISINTSRIISRDCRIES